MEENSPTANTNGKSDGSVKKRRKKQQRQHQYHQYRQRRQQQQSIPI